MASDEAGVTQSWGQPIWQSDFSYTGKPDAQWWSLYNGPGHVGNGTRRPERINVLDGVLRLDGTSGGSTGGMAHELSQRYGRWEARMRAYETGGSGEQYHPVLIIWPDVENWPRSGEYDFIENNVGDTTAGAFIHYPHPPGAVQQEHATKSGIKIADYHNYAIDWQPTGIKGYIDGVQWFNFSGGGGPNGRSNIQDMTPSGHLTIQLDNFGGSSHKTANMDIDWVKIWNKDSVGSNNTINVTGISSAESFPFPLLGNRFRMYLTSSAAPITTAVTPSWEQSTGSIRGLLGLNRGGTNTAVTITEASTSNTFDALAGQWISQPMTSGGTLKGAYSYVIARNESDANADMFARAVVKVVSGDGTVVRGIASELAGPSEFTTTAQAFTVTGNIDTPVTCQPGDRIVVEIGARATNTVATSYSATFRYGGTPADIESGDTGTAITTNSAWVNFADRAVQALFFGQTLTPTSVTSAEAFGTAVLVQPPTLGITGAGGIPTAQAFGGPVVRAEAYPLFPSGFGGEVFGVPSVSNSVVVLAGIPTEEAFGSHRVRRLSDLFVDNGIPSAEAFGALVLVHYQEVAPPSIESAETFGLTEVEDPARRIRTFSILTAEAFGTPTLANRVRSRSIDSAEAFGAPIVKRAFYRLVQPTRVERWRLGDPGNVIYVRNVVGLTVYGDDTQLFTAENPKTETLFSAKYVWQGGHDNITEDQAIRDLWVANNYQVEMSY